MSCVLRKDLDWVLTLSSTDVSGALTLLSEDGCQVPVPAALLVAVSPLVKSILSDLLPPAQSPYFISIPAVTGDALRLVAKILLEGAAVVHANKGEVQEVFKVMGIEASLSYCCVADRGVKNKDFTEATEDGSQSQIYVKMEKEENFDDEYFEDFDNLASVKVENEKIEGDHSERDNSSSEVLLPSNENKPREDKKDKECDKKVPKKNVRQHAVKKTFKCDQCAYIAASSVRTLNRNTVNRAHLKSHMLVHSREKPFACDQCDYKTARLRSLVSHKEKSYECDQCDYKTNHKPHLTSHMLIHIQEKHFECDKCDYKTNHKPHLTRHMLIHIKEKRFECDQCDYKTIHKPHLTSHMLIHIKEKPFECDQCDYKVKTNRNSMLTRQGRLGDLVSHKAFRHKMKPLTCDKCLYRAATSTLFQEHMLTHEKPFACDQCSYRGSRHRHLVRHKANHHHLKPVKCDQCDYRADTSECLQLHILTAEGHKGSEDQHIKEDEAVLCFYCGKKCKSKKRLLKHKKRKHPDSADLS